MKQKDVALIIVIAVFSGLISFFVTRVLFANPTDLKTEVEVVDPISAQFNETDKRYFNSKSINPTQPIKIGDENNTQPFQSQN